MQVRAFYFSSDLYSAVGLLLDAEYFQIGLPYDLSVTIKGLA